MTTMTVERLKQALRYDPETGAFLWIVPPKNHPRLANQSAGGVGANYVMIKIDNRRYKAHRLAWLYVHGAWPTGDIDHINGCPLDNRISNLRIATNPQNQANRRRNAGKETPKGVRVLPSNRFQARITVNKQLKNIGTFPTAELAAKAYLAAAQSHYGNFARAS